MIDDRLLYNPEDCDRRTTLRHTGPKPVRTEVQDTIGDDAESERPAMLEHLKIHRRNKRLSPMSSRRFGTTFAASGIIGGGIEFPGIEIPDPRASRGGLLSGGLSILLHGCLIGGLFLAAWLIPEEAEEKVFELTRVEDEIVKQEPASAPRVVAETRMQYDPSRMALTPQIRSPAVIQPATPVIVAPRLAVETVAPVEAPREIVRAKQVVEQARVYQAQIQATTSPLVVDALSPAVRGPTDAPESGKVLAGPRKVIRGDTIGIADPHALGTGSTVQEGVSSNRDVLGAKTGEKARVNWAVGDSNMRGVGGSGGGPGGILWSDCVARTEVQAYMERIRGRVMTRWALPPEVPGNQRVELRFSLDPAGTASAISLLRAPNNLLGDSAVRALRSASPFDHMSERVRCLAGQPIIATFRNPTIASN